MEIRDYEEIKKKLCKELEEMKQTNKFDRGDVDVIDRTTHAIKNIMYIMENEDGGYSQGGYSRGRYSRDGYSREGYSRDGNWSAEGSYGNYNSNDSGYNRGNSYARRGSRGGYSRGEDEISEGIREMMESGNLSMSDRNTLERAMEILRK